MKPASGLLPTFGLVLLSTLLFAQDPRPIPPDSSIIVTSDLVAWTEQQNPRPMYSPVPDPPGPPKEKRFPPPDIAQADQKTSVRTFTGTIVNDHRRYVLKVGKDQAVYDLDDQQKAKSYEGKAVKVMGMGESEHIIRVISIELIS